MSDNKSIETIANTLISQYGDDAEAVAMLRAAEYAADLNNEEWIKWENIIKKIHSMNESPLHLSKELGTNLSDRCTCDHFCDYYYRYSFLLERFSKM